MGDETPQERQNNEIEALKAIFGDDLVDKRECIAWKIWRPLDLCLTLNPLHSSTAAGNHCSIVLRITCSEMYPNDSPNLRIEKLQGLSNENGIKLLQQLQKLASELCGEVMIFELAQHVQNFLHLHNKPSMSFYDEMLERRNEQERLKMHDLQIKESKERQKIKDEIQRRQQILKAEGRMPRTYRTSIGHDPDDSNESQNDVPELVCYADNKVPSPKNNKNTKENNVDPPCTCTSRGLQILRISQRNNRKVHIGKCLGHSYTGSTTNLGIDAESGDFVTVKKWCVSATTDYQTRNKQLNCIEQDLLAMSRLNCTSLVPYTAMELQQETVDFKKRTTSSYIFLFRDFIFGSSLKHLKSKLSRISDSFEALRLVRHIGSGVLSALVALHEAGLFHRDVRSENVFLDESGSVKLVGACLDVRIQEIVDGGHYCSSHRKSMDVYATAQLLLSLVADTQTDQEIPSHLPSPAKDFFSRCLTEDEHLQWTAEQLLNHDFLRDSPSPVPGTRDQDDGYSGSEEDDRGLARAFVHSYLPSGGHSRLSAEFEVLKWLGKGAFGDVLKVKNKLDGGFYAIKRIKLNPVNVQLNKKITREVKLLSRLNHENVVRYFNAWIETMQGLAVDDNDNSSKGTNLGMNGEEVAKRKDLQVLNSLENAVAKLVPDVRLEWSMSDAPSQMLGSSSSDSSESEDEDDEDDAWFKMLPAAAELDDTSSSIEFEVDTDNRSQTLPSEDTEKSIAPTENIHQVLYIQMEFCEKNTLRQAIDNGLCQEHFRAWRFFREIVEGLAHVHQRGMIHRDLKPVNIFLDSNDHVKIGDFGLATKAFTGLPGPVEDKSKPQEEFGGSLTGQVGTALYVAPELLQAANKVIYNQKVDIYSLGIILFEMFHPRLDTGMERMKMLTDLRLKEIRMPKGFVLEENAKQVHVMRWLLSHDASSRPTCAELLASEHVPRAVPEGALSGLLSHTLSDRRSRGYQRLVTACLDQQFTPAEDFTYHSGLKTKSDSVLTAVRDVIVKVFKLYGAGEFSPPLLLPRAKAWDQYPNAVRLMTAFGSVVHLPHDLRLAFARYTAYAEVKYMRRYTVDRVFREKHVPGFHPRELLECAFDIVTPKPGTLWADAELLAVVSSAVSATGLRPAIQLNHTTILRIVLLSCGVPADKHIDLYPVLVDVRTGRITNLQLQTHLTSLCLTPRDTAFLLRLMESEVPVHEVKELMSPMVKKRSGWSHLVSQAVHDLEVVARNARALGVDHPMTVVPCLAYNTTQHEGIFWQALSAHSSDQNKPSQAKHRSGDIIAVGGRYNALVEDFWKVARSEKENDSELKTCSVGFSMSLERMAALVKKKEGVPMVGLPLVSSEASKVCVCVWGAAGSGRSCQGAVRRAQLARALWAAGLAACALECRAAGEAHELTGACIVLLVEDDDCGTARVTHWHGDRVNERRVPLADAVDYIRQLLQPDSTRSPEASGYNRSVSWSEGEKTTNPLVSVMIITNEKLSGAARRRYETQAIGSATTTLTALGVSKRVCVLALSCGAACVRMLAAHLDAPLAETDLSRAFNTVQDAYPRQRGILTEALEVTTNIATSKNASEDPTILALYSISDGVFRLVT